MQQMRYARAAAVGAVMMAFAFLAVRATATEETTTVPVEMVLAEAAAAPEVASAELFDTQVKWDITPARNARVEYWINFLKGRNRERTRLWLERLGRYGPYIRAQLRARGMPEDLVYLAMIESGFSPVARSHASAVGIWQFIAETGRRYGLRIDGYVDERRDPIRSTEAALDYLQDLYKRFGSWYLAAAAYNTGEGRVERVLRRYAGGRRGDDALFWKIDQYLPRETRDYVPLMLAAAHIGKEPERYGFRNLNYQAPLRFDAVAVPGGTSLEVVARAAQVDGRSIRDLNPQYLRGVTPPGRTATVRLPAGRRQIFAQNFEQVRGEVRLASTHHTVRRGETLSHIARRYGTSVNALRAANDWIHPRRLQVGQQLRIPSASDPSSISVSAEAGKWRIHRVRPGDSLWAISRRYGVSVSQLQAWNGLGRRSKIVPGQRLRIGI